MRIDLTRSKHIVTLIFLSLLGTGCSHLYTPPTTSDLDWNPSELSTHSCPNLSGTYVAPPEGESYRKLLPTGSTSLYLDREDYLKHKDEKIIITIVASQGKMTIEARNDSRSFTSTIVFDGIMTGCSNNSLIYRFKSRPTPHPESGGHTSIVYGERIIKKSKGGDIYVYRQQRKRKATWQNLADTQPYEQQDAAPTVFTKVPRGD